MPSLKEKKKKELPIDLNPNALTCFQSAQKVALSQNDETNDSQVTTRHRPKVTGTEMCQLCKNKFEECLEIAVHLVRK